VTPRCEGSMLKILSINSLRQTIHVKVIEKVSKRVTPPRFKMGRGPRATSFGGHILKLFIIHDLRHSTPRKTGRKCVKVGRALGGGSDARYLPDRQRHRNDLRAGL
jgi:hypothetical protein